MRKIYFKKPDWIMFTIMVFAIMGSVQASFSQTKISGKVTDQKGLSLPGTSVLIKGTSIGAQTDIDGNYVINSNTKTGTLIFTFVGFTTTEVAINSRANINVTLKEDAQTLNEVVVVGYGSQKKSELTGAVASIDASQLTKNSAASIDNALQGKVAGVSVSVNNATPGGGVSVRIRGAGGINNSEPLYVVDGVIFAANGNENSSPLSFINPQDIKSISILKDAASAAIYGARAANGVILITTKRGKGKSTVNVNMSYGSQSIVKTNQMMDASTYASFINTANQNAGLTAPFANPSSFGVGTNWTKVISRSASISDKNVSFSGGDENGNYFLSVGSFNQEGVVIGTDFQRISIRTNADKKITDKLSVGTSISLTRTKQNSFGSARGSNGNPIYEAGQFYPTIPVYDANGDYAPTPANGFYKPYANPLFLVNIPQTPPVVKSLQSNLYLEYKLLKNLSFKTSASYIFGNTLDEDFGRIYNLGAASEIRQLASKFQSSNSTLLVENILNYKFVNEKHNVSVLLGQSAQEYSGESLFATGYYNDGGHKIIDQTANNFLLTNDIQESSLSSYFGRLNYGYKGKYLMTANFRYDGSSKFGINNKWGFFPSVSGAWNISEENFFPKNGVLNSLKLRSGWGKVGSEEIGNYATTSAIGSIYGYGFGNTSGSLATGSAANSIANPDLKWETVTQFSAGFDASFFDNKLTLTAEYYKKENTDILLSVPQSAVTGLSNGLNQGSIVQNIAAINNSGIELSVNYSSKIGKFTYDLGANLTTINNKVIKLGPGGKLFNYNFKGDNQTLTQVGGELGQFYGFVADGLFQSQAEIAAHPLQNANTAPGDIRFKNLDGNNVIDNNDKTVIGSPIPDFVYGFNFNFGYDKFDLSIQATGSYGNDILNLSKNDLIDNTTSENKLNFSPWSPTNTGSLYPRANVQDPNKNNRPSSYYVEDGSYLKIKVMQLGYTLDANLLKKIKMSNLRVYTSVQNPFVFTKYSGLDPEVGNAGGSNLSAGIDHFVYPVQRTISLGLNASF